MLNTALLLNAALVSSDINSRALRKATIEALGGLNIHTSYMYILAILLAIYSPAERFETAVFFLGTAAYFFSS